MVPEPVDLCLIALIFEPVLLALDCLEVYGHHLPLLLSEVQLGREETLQDVLLQANIGHQYAVFLSRWRTVQFSEFFHLVQVLLVLFEEGLLLEDEHALAELLVRIEDPVFLRVVENDGLEVAWSDAIDEIVNFLEVGVETVGQALNGRGGT